MKALLSILLFTALFAGQAPRSAPEVTYELASVYRKEGATWIVIAVPPGLPQAKLIALTKKLHQQTIHESAKPVRYRFVDDTTQLTAYVNWTINYPSTRFPYPEQWTKQHHLAFTGTTLNEQTGRPAWFLMDAFGSQIALIE